MSAALQRVLDETRQRVVDSFGAQCISIRSLIDQMDELGVAGPVAALTRPRIIVLSGRGREQDVMRAFDLGADDDMTKPFNPQELMARIGRPIK